MFDLKPLIFVMCRLTALFYCIGNGQENRRPESRCLSVREKPTHFRQVVSEKIFARIPSPYPVQSTICFPLHFWTAQKGLKSAEKQGDSVSETHSPVS